MCWPVFQALLEFEEDQGAVVSRKLSRREVQRFPTKTFNSAGGAGSTQWVRHPVWAAARRHRYSLLTLFCASQVSDLLQWLHYWGQAEDAALFPRLPRQVYWQMVKGNGEFCSCGVWWNLSLMTFRWFVASSCLAELACTGRLTAARKGCFFLSLYQYLIVILKGQFTINLHCPLSWDHISSRFFSTGDNCNTDTLTTQTIFLSHIMTLPLITSNDTIKGHDDYIYNNYNCNLWVLD